MDQPRPHSASRPWLILLFWLSVIGVLYGLMSHILAPPAAVYHPDGRGTLELQRHRDGHFYADGKINNVPVNFMVDTGASLVSISDEVATAANLSGGERSVFYTANGAREGRIVEVDRLTLSGFELRSLRVGTGLNVGSSKDALLGQNVLSHFNVSIEGNTMTLRPR